MLCPRGIEPTGRWRRCPPDCRSRRRLPARATTVTPTVTTTGGGRSESQDGPSPDRDVSLALSLSLAVEMVNLTTRSTKKEWRRAAAVVVAVAIASPRVAFVYRRSVCRRRRRREKREMTRTTPTTTTEDQSGMLRAMSTDRRRVAGSRRSNRTSPSSDGPWNAANPKFPEPSCPPPLRARTAPSRPDARRRRWRRTLVRAESSTRRPANSDEERTRCDRGGCSAVGWTFRRARRVSADLRRRNVPHI